MRGLNNIVKRDMPPLEYELDLVEFAIPLIPYVLGALREKERKYNWADDSALLARQQLAEQGAKILMGGIREITNRQDALYALLDRGINGTVYAVSGDGTEAVPYSWLPAIPIAPNTSYNLPGAMKTDEIVMRLLDNLNNGTIYPEAPSDRTPRQILEEILAAYAETNSLDAEQLAQLIQIAASVL